MQNIRRFAIFLFTWIVLLGWLHVSAAPQPQIENAAVVTSVDGPPQRSTYFDRAGRITYPAAERFNRNAAMTIEAWVYPTPAYDDPIECQTLVEHQQGASYWFGACPKLRFYRSDNNFVESSEELKSFRWTHVAVSYDGATATFYLNGEVAGSAPLIAPSSLITHDLNIGGSVTDMPFYRGRLDEIRIWSVARSGDEIGDNMFRELRSGAGLEATFGDGGRNEDLAAVAGTATGPSQPDVFGLLPRNLVLPGAAITPTLDAYVNPILEYAGAEQVAVRYTYTGTGGIYNDLPAYLVRTDSDLFVGMPTVQLAAPTWPQETSWIGLMLDVDNSGDALAHATDYQIRVYLNDPKDTPADASATLYVGDGAGNWVPCTDPACPQRGVDWDADTRYDASSEISVGQVVEIRVAKSLLGEWTDVDGLAFGQLEFGAPVQDHIAPVEAVQNSPMTWSQVAYSEGSAQLPQAQVKGKVYAGPNMSSPALAGQVVIFGDINSGMAQQVTDANGEFAFDVRVPADKQLRLQINTCTNCRYETATTIDYGNGPVITPTLIGGTFLFLPGCAAGTTCAYMDTQFYVRQPPGATVVNATSPQVSMIVNSAGNVTPVTYQLLTGENLHDLTKVYLSPVPDKKVTDIANWTLYEAQIITRSADMKSLKVKVPTLEKSVPRQNGGPIVNALTADWRWVVKDDWQRPDNFDGYRVSGSFKLRMPEYPTIFGFGFDNEGQSGTRDEFAAVYGNNAYICIGAFGFCATHIPDPLYWTIWYPVFKIWIGASGGSCVGMASTSQLMYRGDLKVTDFSSDAYFPAGITDRSAPADWDYGTFGILTGPPKAANLWAEIRKNHGVQTSAEFIYEGLNQLDGVSGDPRQRLYSMRAGPHDFVVSFVDLGGGHAVTPYATNVDRVDIYDNNYPLSTGQYIKVDEAANTYESSTSFSGTGIFAIDIDVWRGEHTMPLDIPGIAMNLVFGSADAKYENASGQEWGWQPDGSFVDTMPDATPFVPLDAVTGTHNIPLFVPVTSTMVSNVQVNTQGGDYFYYTGSGGNALQLQVFDAPAGDQDELEVKANAGQVNGFSYQPASPSDNFVPKLGTDLGEQQRLLFRWGGLETPGAGKVTFTSNPEAKAADFVNNTGITTTHYLVVDSIDAREGIETTGTWRFGPFAIPDGATQRTTIVDWPTSWQLRSEIDLDGDGVFESSEVVTGRQCASEDLDENGLPDLCEFASNLFIPAVAR
jgi:hypothetical protein